MSSQLTELDKQTIATIDEQVAMLLEKSATDVSIVNTLIDFIPDVKCLLDADGDKQLVLHCRAYPNFTYFANLIEEL